MLLTALKAEVDAYVAAHTEERDGEGHALVVRHGVVQPRKLTTAAGELEIEAQSTFATVRLRIKKPKGAGSRGAGLAMAYKLLEAAQARWRSVNAPHLVALIIRIA